MSRLGLRPGAALRFRTEAGAFAYDCHAVEFAPLAEGGDLVSGFVPLYLASLFGIEPGRWQETLAAVAGRIAALAPRDRDAHLAGLRPARTPARAAAIAAAAFPSVERFVRLAGEAGDPEGPFVLREDLLFPPAPPPLVALEGRAPGGRFAPLALAVGLREDDGRAAIRRVLGRLGRGAAGLDELGGDEPADRALAQALVGAGVATPTEGPLPAPPPGLYALGHSGLLVRGARAGLLIDPVLASRVAAHPQAIGMGALRPLADAVALTHGHFDHYHLPTLLGFEDLPIIVPPVGRGSIVCEEIAARLRSFGVADVRSPAWGTRFELGDLAVHVLPFVGEQFLTSERYPEARNWGSCFVIEAADARILVAADAGFEPGRSVIDVAAAWRAEHGPVDVVAAQAIALRTTFGGGDADLQITALTCANRAPEAFALLRPEARVTLAVDDLPALCRATGARQLVPYGQFRFARGAPAVDPTLAARAAGALREAGLATEVAALAVGEGVPLAAGASGPVRLGG